MAPARETDRESDRDGAGAVTEPLPTRPASLWPDTAQQPRSTGFGASTISRFDPLAEERARDESLAAAAFDVCQPALALRALLLVQAVLAVAALASAGGLVDWAGRQALLAFSGVAGTGSWLVAICALRRPLRRLAAPRRAGLVLALGSAAGALGWAPLALLGLGGEPLAWRAAGSVLAGAGLAALLWAWLELRARIWQPSQAQARLAELQSRIRPHFLFNALNTALALVRVDPARAEGVLEDLSELFRVALADAGASVALGDEIELARRYLAIEQVRFGSRLSVQWEIDPQTLAARVPPLMLQPLVENAVRHGVEPAADGGRVWIRAEVRRGQVVVTVSNSVGDEPSPPGHGMALHNLRERLRLLHDVAARCDAWREGDRFHARIVLPAG